MAMILITIALAENSYAQTFNSDQGIGGTPLFSDDFADGNRNGWIEINDDSSSLSVKSKSGQMGTLPELTFAASDKSSLKSFAVHFPEVELKKQGDFVTLQFDARHRSVGFVDRGFRFGLFDSGGTRFSADGDFDSDDISLDDDGYFAIVDLGISTTRDSALIREKNNAVDQRLWNGSTIASDDNDGGRDPLMFTRNRSFTYTLTLKRNGEGNVDIVLKNSVSGDEDALTGISKLTPTLTLDTIYFGTRGSTEDFAIDNVVVTNANAAGEQLAKKIHVGVYVDDGSGPSVKDLLFALGKFENVSIKRLKADDIRSGKLAGLGLLIHPGGSGGGQGRHLGEGGRDAIRNFVRDGGGYIGICAGSYLASADYSWSLNILDAKVIDRKHWNRGTGAVDIAITDAGQQLLKPKKPKLAIFYGQGPLLAPGNRPDIDDYEAMATFETEIAKNGAPRGVMKGTTAIAKGKYGNGRVICFSPHPELTKGLESLVQCAINHVKRNRPQTNHKLLAAERKSPAAKSSRPVLQVINGSRQNIEIFWLKSDTERISNGQVKPGKDSFITTTIGHRFAIVGEKDGFEVTATGAVPVQAVRFDPPDKNGVPAFYAQRVSANGFPIVASKKVNPYALKEAAYLVNLMLAKRPDVRDAMIKSGARLCILARNEFTTDQPEWAGLAKRPVRGFPNISPRDYRDARARGMGGSTTDPFCSCAEENLLGYPGDPYSAECILIHELAHNIHLRGMVNVDPTFDARLKANYEAAMSAGLWKGKYASVNHHEYFAEGVQSWFDNNRENDHDHNHVNTRDELMKYDPLLAEICREVFGDTKLRYTKPATRLNGHLSGYDPAKAPRFEWPERLNKAKEAIRRAAQRRSQESSRDYKR